MTKHGKKGHGFVDVYELRTHVARCIGIAAVLALDVPFRVRRLRDAFKVEILWGVGRRSQGLLQGHARSRPLRMILPKIRIGVHASRAQVTSEQGSYAGRRARRLEASCRPFEWYEIGIDAEATLHVRTERRSYAQYRYSRYECQHHRYRVPIDRQKRTRSLDGAGGGEGRPAKAG